MNIFNEAILNIPKKFIPHETALNDDRDPAWFNERIKSLICKKTKPLNGLAVTEGTFA